MKKTILSFIILILSFISTAQCVRLYVNEHLLGSPICRLTNGDYIEICEDENEVHGCPYDFYVYNKGWSNGNLTYELSLDKGRLATHYLTLMVNTQTQRFGFIQQGQTAMYSYYTEADINARSQRRLEEARKLEKKNAELELIDTKNYNQINQLIDKEKIDEAWLKYNQLNFQSKFPRKNELESKKDALLKTQIKNLLYEKKFDAAIEKYYLLNLQETKNELKREVHLALSQYYETFEQPFTNEQLINIINEHKYDLSKLSTGNHQIYTNSEGKISIDMYPTGLKIPPITKSLGQNGEFIVNTLAVGTIKIETSTNNYGDEQIQVSTHKTIYKTGKGKLFKQGILGFEPMGDVNRISVLFREDIPSNHYRKVQPILTTTKANGIEINSIYDNQLIAEEKFKNRILEKTSTALIISSIALYYILML